MKYRVEIDGLRAFAILPVVLFHAGFTTMSGGFLGVDIFFVISGYLITTIIYQELLQERFSIVAFYERRARRILPALVFMLFVTTVVGFITFSPQQLKDYGQSLVSVAVFSSNVYFYLTSGYFSKLANEIPLLHTWSLAVEEQFYIFFPLLLMLVFHAYQRLVSAIVLISCGSFLTALWLQQQDSSANFYLIFSRAWELLAGAFVALYYGKLSQINRQYRNWLASLGLVVIIISLFIFSRQSQHPGFITLLPVLGTCLVIAFSANTAVARLLSFPVFVSIGVVSYSLYLWHQPVFAFIHLKLPQVSYIYIALAFTVTYVLSVCSYRLVEAPFRAKNKVSRQQLFLCSAISLASCLAVGLWFHLSDGLSERFNTSLDYKSIKISPLRYECHSSHQHVLNLNTACKFGGSKPNIAVLGDSHGVELSYVLGSELKPLNQGLLQLTFSSCPPVLLETSAKGCKLWLEAIIAELEKHPTIHTVILVYRHALYLNGDQLSNLAQGKINGDPYAIALPDETASDTEIRQRYWQSFDMLVSRLKQHNKNVILVYPIPELKKDISKYVMPTTIFDAAIPEKQLVESFKFYQQRTFNILPQLDEVVKKYQLKSVIPAKVLCNQVHCKLTDGKHIFYFDDDHLSIAGANVLAKELMVILKTN
jgi:peptidoglycan/LPS O-acetylase OafA/YrhL